MSDKTVMFNSPEAAQYRTDINGWVSRRGCYFGEGPRSEEMARYDGCTHTECAQCGALTRKGYETCSTCRELTCIAQYEAMPRKEWDGKVMVYSEARDRYYNSPDDAAYDLDDGQTLADLRLIICEPNYGRKIDRDFFFDELQENGELPDEVYEAMAEFNKAVAGIVLSWSPGKFALVLPDQPAVSEGD